jgi:triosephosphate isomerase
MITERWLIGNWKMHKTPEEALAFLQGWQQRPQKQPDNWHHALAVPNTVLYPLRDLAASSRTLLAAQNLHHQEQGAYTGEVGAEMLRAAGANMVLVGHSERRLSFGDTLPWVTQKLLAASKSGLHAVLCIGETAEERAQGLAMDVLAEQLKSAFKADPSILHQRMIVAYEPVWAIGTGKVADAEILSLVFQYIRGQLLLLSPASGGKVPLLYGGSVQANNAQEILQIPEVCGLLVGKASLTLETWLELAQVAFSVSF